MQDFDIKIDKKGMNRIGKLSVDFGKYMSKPVRALKQIGLYMLGSIEKNFEAEGRPVKWVPLSPMTIAARRKGKSSYGMKILSDTGTLRNSINFQVAGDGSSVSIGTNVKYAAIHNFGGTIKIPKRTIIPKNTKALRFMVDDKIIYAKKVHQKARTIKIPQRQFLLFLPEDVEAIRQIIVADLQKKLGEQ